MKKLKKIELRLEKEVISNLNGNNLENFKGGANSLDCETTKIQSNVVCTVGFDCQKETNKSACCTYASNAICLTQNAGACYNNSIGYGGEGLNCYMVSQELQPYQNHTEEIACRIQDTWHQLSLK